MHINLIYKLNLLTCVTSSEAVGIFKNAFMLSNEMEYIIDPGGEHTQDDLQLLIKWFNLCKEYSMEL